MKKKPLKLRLPYFFRQRFHDNDSSDQTSQLAKPESDWEGAESVIKDILRWADDGGKMLTLGNRTASSNPDTARSQANE
jgi:hypothetical protein